MPQQSCPDAAESLKRACHRLDGDLAACRSELRKLLRTRRTRASKLISYQEGAFIMLCRWGGDVEAVRHWVQATGIAAGDVDGVIEVANQKYREVSVAEREKLKADASLPKCCSTRNSRKVAEEYKLYAWVYEQNIQKGLAPTSKHILRKRAADAQEVVRCCTLTSRQTGKQWVRRWRKRWGVQLGRFANRETIAVQVTQQKVLRATCRHFGDPFNQTPSINRDRHRTQFVVQNLAPFSGPLPHFLCKVRFVFRIEKRPRKIDNSGIQAAAFWQWSNFLHSFADANKPAVHINLDETSVKFCQDAGLGLVVERARQMKRKPRSLTRSVGHDTLRGTCTHVAMVCDLAEIQKQLPQFILVKERHLTVADFNTIKLSLPENVYLLRGKSSWMNGQLMHQVLATLAKRLRPVFLTHEVFLTADAYRPHLLKKIWAAAGARGIFYCTVPSHLTWALQPCDTHVFSQYKAMLGHELLTRSLENTTGKITVSTVIMSVCKCIQDLLETKSWAKAFADTGLIGHQFNVSDRVWDKLGFGQPQTGISNDIPSLSQLQCVLPSRYQIPIDEVFSCVKRRAMQQIREEKFGATGPSVPTCQSAASSSGLVANAVSHLDTAGRCPPTSLAPPPLPPPLLTIPLAARLPPNPSVSRSNSSRPSSGSARTRSARASSSCQPSPG